MHNHDSDEAYDAADADPVTVPADVAERLRLEQVSKAIRAGFVNPDDYDLIGG